MPSISAPEPPDSSGSNIPLAVVAVLATAALFRAFRLLGLFPILVDESIYLRWAEIIQHQHQWFISLLDAKQPLSYWVYAVLRMVWNGDPLLAARMVSVCAGVGSTAVLIALGRRLHSARAGLIAGALYAVMPYGVFYDRLAYTDALVNLAGLSVTFASVYCFGGEKATRRGALAVGLALGIGYFTKSTVLLFGLAPVAAALAYRRGRGWEMIARLVESYVVAAIFPSVSMFLVPPGPTFDVNNLLLHHTSFFTPPAELIAHPWVNASRNLRLVSEYAACYMTIPFTIAALACAVSVCFGRPRVAWLMLSVFAVPALFMIAVLEYFPSRYLFPLVWPLVLAVAIAICEVSGRIKAAHWSVYAAIAAVPLLLASLQFLRHPDSRLHAIDAAEFTSSGPFSGYGIREAADDLLQRAGEGPAVVLTDPIWGPPTDAIAAYLNGQRGIRVFEAWWMQLSEAEPILPRKPREVMRSQYERVSAGTLDFSSLPRVYYVTDTNYNRPPDVTKRQPDARLAARFRKRNGIDFIDVYRLR